jgi:hypothetical protein
MANGKWQRAKADEAFARQLARLPVCQYAAKGEDLAALA